MSNINYFKFLREKAGLTQKQVSIYLGYTTIQLVSNWERGLCMPPRNSIQRLAKLFNVDKKQIGKYIYNYQLNKLNKDWSEYVG